MKRNWQKLSDMKQVTNYEAYHVCDPRSNGWKVGETYNTSAITRPLPKEDFKRCIEEAAEIQRKSINPHLPSRANCLFVCKKENVRWFLDSGTELASLREQDIIPWDDDMDIKVFREDYPAFCEAMRKHLPEYLHFIEPQDYSPAFYDFIPRIYDERYPLREETAEDRYYKNYQNRIGIDVFIFDVAPDSEFKRKMMKFRYKVIYGLGMRSEERRVG